MSITKTYNGVFNPDRLNDELFSSGIVPIEFTAKRDENDVYVEIELVLPDDVNINLVDSIVNNHVNSMINNPPSEDSRTPEQKLEDDLEAATDWQQVRAALLDWVRQKI